MIIFFYTFVHSYATDVIAVRANTHEEADEIIKKSYSNYTYESQFNISNTVIQNIVTIEQFGT